MARKVRIHIDTLEYTRQGLKTRQPVPLEVGQHNQLVLVRPDRLTPEPSSYAGFPAGSSFPGPAVLALALRIKQTDTTDGVFQIFAHARPDGSESDAKTLTDERGRAAYALLVGDIDEGLATLEAGDWDEHCTQVMLRALRCDPGPIDGNIEDESVAALRRFQQRYMDGVFHTAGALPRFELLADGELNSDTHQALVEAYLLAFSPALDEGAFHPKAPVAGCGGFNLVVDAPGAALNDRVSLIRYVGSPPHPDSAPCTTGDPGPCAVVDDALQRCMWFREHVRDPHPKQARHEHFLPMWRRLEDGQYALTVLTTVPDDEEVVFEVLTASVAVDGSSIDPAKAGPTLSEELRTHPHRGVARVTWTPPPSFVPDGRGRIRLDDGSAEVVPAFRVTHPGSSSGGEATLYASYPARAAASTIPAGVFGFDSSFPRPGIWASLSGFPELLAAGPAGVVAFGHTDAVGSDAYNKHLSDRRARAVWALVESNLEELSKISKEEDWGTDAYQAMLRAVGCDPGPPDDDAGDMTAAAVRAFQIGYPRGLFIDPQLPRASGSLEATGALDGATKASILEAYLHHLGLGLDRLPTVGRRFAGCGEFNRLSEDASDNRRVTLAVFRDVPEDGFPCTVGDETRCALDGAGGMRRCSFYRETVDEPGEPAVVTKFFDDHWVPTPSARAYMSVLTSLPDDTPVTFTIYRCGPDKPIGTLSSDYDDTLPEGLEEVVVLEGRVLHGVAFATWEGDDDFHPFDSATWFDPESVVPLADDFADKMRDPTFVQEQIELLRGGRRYRPPLFHVEAGNTWFLSRPPGRRVRGLEVRRGEAGEDEVRRLFLRPDGRVYALESSDAPARHDDAVAMVSMGPTRMGSEVEE